AEFCMHLDTPDDAEKIHHKFLNIYLAAHAGGLAGLSPGRLDVVIVGAGATGVELSAELHASVRKLIGYGLDEIPRQDVSISLVEAGPHLLPALSVKLASSVEKHLHKIGVQLYLKEKVNSVTAEGVHTESGKFIPGTLTIWAAGVKAPDVTGQLDGLAVNRNGQIEIRPTLQTTQDDAVFAIGDCSALADSTRRMPPTAQVANQEAIHLAKNLGNFIDAKPLHPFTFNDMGTLVSLGETSTFGVLMGNLLGTRTIRGLMARIAYLWLYRRHQYGLFGLTRTLIITLGDNLRRTVGPRLKLH
ncbi:MAG TPA: FAD-dependent oxidoreductase, partial [Pseudomonadales bacterium]|nr:FAD-dependent oxidoreductase [Pseudomonadales bacterium]